MTDLRRLPSGDVIRIDNADGFVFAFGVVHVMRNYGNTQIREPIDVQALCEWAATIPPLNEESK